MFPCGEIILTESIIQLTIFLLSKFFGIRLMGIWDVMLREKRKKVTAVSLGIYEMATWSRNEFVVAFSRRSGFSKRF